MPDFLFTIVTDNPERALADALRCAFSNKPPFVTVVSDPHLIDRLRGGTKCDGMFYAAQSEPLTAFRYRQMRGGLVWLDNTDRDWIKDWVRLHLIACAERNARYPLAEWNPDCAPGEGESAIAKPSPPEIQNLVLTQKWT